MQRKSRLKDVLDSQERVGLGFRVCVCVRVCVCMYCVCVYIEAAGSPEIAPSYEICTGGNLRVIVRGPSDYFASLTLKLCRHAFVPSNFFSLVASSPGARAVRV